MARSLLQLTIKDILKRPLFRDAEVLASETALKRVVRWVHIIEVSQVGHLLNGKELILSTGIGWNDDPELSVAFLQQLIDCGAAGLCIELIYTKQPLQEMKELAIRENFPLILFHKEVRYIDITQDLHTIFINRHHQMVSDLESLSARFNQLLLSGQGITSLLELLQEATHAQVALFPLEREAEYVPPLPKNKAEALYHNWLANKHSTTLEVKRRTAHRPILALDHLFADLIIYSDKELSEFDILALDRCSTAVAQEIMRTSYMEEKRRFKEDLWIIDWLTGQHSFKEVRDYIHSINSTIKLNKGVVCLFEPEQKHYDDQAFESTYIQKTMIARSVIEKQGFFLLSTLFNKQIVYILLDQFNRTTKMDTILELIHRLQKGEENQKLRLFSHRIGVGKEIADLAQIQKSYESAQETILIQKDIGPLKKPFYSELHVHRIISSLKKTGGLTSFIEEYIGPVIQYDLGKNSQLLRTLKVYLLMSCSKQDTAKELFIVRQTLYHRLDKIASLLGEDFVQHEKRLAIELALHAYEYLNGSLT
ncbi:PucR family transcriptional regulator [Paenibacillus albiflavus]|uniref:PucR family transcriptional regulator n=1 Tax=Paenibacillus albiflavus TaxID=2545760 RepID=A0A4R4EEB7_9BACL|nr:PucR family transcriptional regulator [Paenibacillus albiflavus]TCZ76511.1 PucR family transcriptional regulator [Paenibacillus albiflavus]